MQPVLRIVLVLGLASAASARAEDKVFSGPQPGEKIRPFKVLEITGPRTVQEVEIIDTKKGNPTFVVFVHRITEPAIGLMIPLEWYAKRLEGLDSHYVILTNDRARAEQQATRWWTNLFSGSRLSISLEGAEGPGHYGLNRHVAMTVLVANKNKVVANFTYMAPNQNDAREILAALAKVMDKEAPSYEKLREEIRADRARRREMRQMQNPVVKAAPDPELGKLMLRLLRREDNSRPAIQKAADALVDWAGDNAERKAVLTTYCRTVLEKFEYSEHAARVLRKLAGKTPKRYL